MSDLVENPEDWFSHNEAHMWVLPVVVEENTHTNEKEKKKFQLNTLALFSCNAMVPASDSMTASK